MSVALALVLACPSLAPVEWICVDCTDECENTEHSWARARRLVRADGSVAWLLEPPAETEP